MSARSENPSTGLHLPPTLAWPGDSPTPDVPPAIPGYEMLGCLGRGGMGVVYKARQVNLDRVVALKMLRDGALADAEQRTRVRTEAEAVAHLQHPHIVTIHEIGEHEGRPFLALEFCGGGGLDQRLARAPLSPRDAAAVVETLARAMHVAHQRGIVHRDLKPANVLFTADGVLKISDFGLAKKLDEVGQTVSGAIMGTPSYMAPEQAGYKPDAQARGIGPAADVYALGAILYECLAGRPPFKAATHLDTLLQVIGDDPVPPSRLQPKVPRDLETICLKCLHKQPRKRYATAEELADDLRRFLANEPIRARASGVVERSMKWAKRRPAAAALLAVSAAALAVVLCGFAYYNAALRHERNVADDKRKEAERQTKLAEKRLWQSHNLLLTMNLRQAGELAREDPAHALDILYDPVACVLEARDFTWGWLVRQCQRDRLTLPISFDATSLAVSADGNLLAVGGAKGVEVWNLVNGTKRFAADAVGPVALSPDGKLLATGGKGKVTLWDTMTGKVSGTRALRDEDEIVALAFSDDRKLAAGTKRLPKGGEVRAWDAAGAALPTPTLTGPLHGVAFTGNGNGLVLCADFAPPRLIPETEVLRWDFEKKEEQSLFRELLLRDERVHAVSLNGGRFAWTAPFEGVTVHDLDPKGEKRRPSPQPPFGISALAFSRDTNTLAVAAEEEIRLYDMKAGKQITRLPNAKGVRVLTFTRDGRTLISAGTDSVKRWDITFEDHSGPVLSMEGAVNSLAFTRDGKHLIAAAADQVKKGAGEVKWWDAQRKQVRTVKGGGPAALSPDGKLLAVVTDGVLKLWDVEKGEERQRLQLGRAAAEVLLPVFAPDGKTLAVTLAVFEEGDGERKRDFKTPHEVILFDAATGQERHRWKCDTQAVAFSPKGEFVATSEGRNVVFRSPATGQEVRRMVHDVKYLYDLTFSPDGKTLVGADYDMIWFWDVETGFIVRGAKGVGVCVAYSPDGRTLASVKGSEMVQLWDATTGQERQTLKFEAHHQFFRVAFAPDGKTLVGGTFDGKVVFWEAARNHE